MQVSAFVDGELAENEADLLLRRMSQDSELRQAVAEYLAIGRLMRAEPGLAGADRLHERISAAIDDRPADETDHATDESPSRAIRPLAGIAIAATVALVAIFALQQSPVVEEGPATSPVVTAVPDLDAQQERQRQFLINHAESSSDYGANGINSRVVNLRFSEEVTPEELGPDAAEDAASAEQDDDADVETSQQP